MTVALRYIADSIVQPATKGAPTLQLENTDGGTATAIGALPVMPPEGQNVFLPGDVLFSKLRPYLAKSFRVRERIHGTGEFICIRPREVLDPDYLKYLTLRFSHQSCACDV